MPLFGSAESGFARDETCANAKEALNRRAAVRE
jgi:hypothetical protein